jgi:glycine/D-amino acid oxidase-like deaminating enzyme
MSLHFGSLFWPSTFNGSTRFPPLRMNKKTRVVIIGGGVSGTLCGYVLAKSGIPAILIEQNSLASGSTLANTGLLQYSNDILLSEFTETLGEQAAVSFYRACKQAAEHLCSIAAGLPRDVHFKRRSSLYYASTAEDVPSLHKEYELLTKFDFGVAWWEQDQIAAHFPFRKAAAIVTRGDAEVNPCLFVQALAEEAVQAGLEIHENTAMYSVVPTSRGYRVLTPAGEIEAEQIIYAVGYAVEQAGGHWIQAKLNRSYAIVTEPMASLSEWHEQFLIWESARPYLYMRTTVDHRIIVGGLDESVRQPIHSEQELQSRSATLLTELHKLFPSFSAEIRYEWCATFGESADGLPWLGEDPERPGQYYCLGYGGNGIVYSMLGAELIRDHLLGIANPITNIVRPDRVVR